jgi:hypothetical protein
MDALEVRTELLARLRADLIGPLADDEALRSRPSDVYVTGILWPLDSRMGAEDDDARADESDDDPVGANASPVGQQRPCVMGLSFATKSPIGHSIVVSASFAVYLPTSVDGVVMWSRQSIDTELLVDLQRDVTQELEVPLTIQVPGLDVRLHLRTIGSAGGLLSTATLINRSVPAEPDRESVERLTMFQCRLVVSGNDSTRLVPRPPAGGTLDADGESALLLYRRVHDFAAGHQCSVSWEAVGDTAEWVATEWVPTAQVPKFSEGGDEVFGHLASTGALSASRLSAADDHELVQTLGDLVSAYGVWIDSLGADVNSLDARLQPIARRHIQACVEVRNRMQLGVQAIGQDAALREAFRTANAAMALQHSWKRGSDGNPLGPLEWRPFQLGFILLAAESSCRRTSSQRDVLDLLWFPTGGGKTEAYLALVAMVAIYRRLREETPDEGSGNAALMRYTLRLLTAQQFERASALVLALELIRLGRPGVFEGASELGSVPFSAGLWVGGDATPNSFRKALESRGSREGSSAEQIDRCPACGTPVHWTYDERSECVQPECLGLDCPLGAGFGLWPIYTVDSDIYREKPTLVIGTVDKFAQLPFREEMAALFGFRGLQATDLIIQDELHLISGPLGTVVGLYETAFDWLLGFDGSRPKVVGSTATIRRAEDQVRAIFDRDVCQFPPPGLDHANSGFAVVDEDKSRWRLYVGVTTAGRSAKFTLQAVAGSLLQSSGATGSCGADERDGYSTLLAYFNSLRELGGAIVQVLDDVPDSIGLYSRRRGEEGRHLDHPRELTSGVSQREIVAIMAALQRTCLEDGSVDVVLATNMVSVGMDIPRLGLMLVNGQPKTRSEYIQSTSRVGRSSAPGLVVCVLNAAKARDRSHFETFPSWHGALYRDVEATSVTPFASRARDKALRAVLVSMIRHSVAAMSGNARADLSRASAEELSAVVEEIDRRVMSVDPKESAESMDEIDEALQHWEDRAPSHFHWAQRPRQSLLEFAETSARRAALGRRPTEAWPTLNNMRSVEPSTRFRMAESLTERAARSVEASGDDAPSGDSPVPRWRRRRDGQ